MEAGSRSTSEPRCATVLALSRAGEVMRAVANLQNGLHSFKASNNNSSPSEQMMRLACQQEESAHRKDGRTAARAHRPQNAGPRAPEVGDGRAAGSG